MFTSHLRLHLSHIPPPTWLSARIDPVSLKIDFLACIYLRIFPFQFRFLVFIFKYACLNYQSYKKTVVALFFSMPKFAFSVVCLDIEMFRPHYFCAPKFLWTPYVAILAKTLNIIKLSLTRLVTGTWLNVSVARKGCTILSLSRYRSSSHFAFM